MAAIHTLTSLIDSIASVALVTWLVRITVLAALACMYLSLARRAQPALRHAIAVGSLVAVVLLPVASKLMPAVNLPVLKAPIPVLTVNLDQPGTLSIDTSSKQTPPPATVGAMGAPAKTMVAAAPIHKTGARELVLRGVAIARDAFLSSRNWIRFGIVLWVLVATGLLIRLAMAVVRAQRVASRATLVTDEFVRVEIERACRALGVTRWIDLAVTNEIAVPLVFGLGNPRIILPVSAQNWSRQRLAVVLLHEVAHIRRRDCASMLFARSVSALFWFHPLVVMLSRDVRRESERACDQLVLSTGVRGSDYAEHLVSIARLSSLRDPLAASTLAFAARSTLEQRVFSILGGRLRTTTRRMITAIAVVAVGAFAVVAAMRPTHAAVVEKWPPSAFHVRTLTPAQQARIDRQVQRAQEQMSKLSVITPRQQARINKQVEKLQDHVGLTAQEQARLNKQVERAAKEASRMDARTLNRINYQVNRALQNQLVVSGKECDLVSDKEDDGEEWYDRAGTYYKDRKFDKAGRAYENAARFGYNTAVAFYNAGCSYALSHQDDVAIRMLQNALENGFDDPEKYDSDEDLNSLRGDARFQKLVNDARHSEKGLQSLRQAEDQYQSLALASTVDNGNWNQVGIDLMRAGAFDRAAEAFDNEYKESGDIDAIYNKACARALQGKSKEALDLLEQCIALNDVDTGHMLSDPDLMALHNEKRFDALVVMANDLNLSSSWQHDNKAWKGDEQKRWVVVLPRFEAAARRYPRIGRAWANLGFIQLKGEQAHKSIESYQKALNLGFRNPATLYNLGCASAQAGNSDAAFKFLDKAEKAGFDVHGYAQWDNDLDPLKADPRWNELQDRWQEEEGQKDREKDIKKYD